MSLFERITASRLIPVVVTDATSTANALGDALVAGGLPVAEITLRTDSALEIIKRLSSRGDILIGAGTVRDAEDVDRARDAGAQFIVSPGTNPESLTRAIELGILAIPGAMTPTEILAALKFGVPAVKFFPAASAGGPAAVKAIASAFPDVQIIPTGGITLQSAPNYLHIPSVVAIGGSWMVPRTSVEAGDIEIITKLVSQAVALTSPQYPDSSQAQDH